MSMTQRLIQMRGWVVSLLLLAAIVVSQALPIVTSAFVGLGGYISEKNLSSGTAGTLYLGNGTQTMTVLGSGPTISTGAGVSGVASSTLHGNLTSLNGMPRADVWFTWGYTPAMVNTTAAVTVTTTGDKTVTITPDPGKTVYFRFVAGTDGTSYGSVASFLSGDGRGIGFWMIRNLLLLVIAAGMLITLLLLTGSPLLAFIATVIGIICFYIIQAIMQLF